VSDLSIAPVWLSTGRSFARAVDVLQPAFVDESIEHRPRRIGGGEQVASSSLKVTG
jgi:hypothetical protein